MISPSVSFQETGASRNRNRYAVELPSSEHIKHPSASVNPDNQLLFKLGNFSDFWKLIISISLIFLLIIFLLKLSKKSLKFFFLLGKIILPLNNNIIK